MTERTRNHLGQFVKDDRAEVVPARVLERRVPQASTQQVRFVSPGQAMVPEWDAANAIRNGYDANIYVNRCINVIAMAIAGLPIRCTPFAAGKDPAAHNPNHPLARLLSPPPGGPNPQTSTRALIDASLRDKLTTGRFAWELEKPQGATGDDWQPVAFWRLPSVNLRVIPTSGGSSLFAGFEYGRPDQPRRLSTSQVFYHWKRSVGDDRQAESALQASRYDVSVAVMQDRYDYSFLKNDATPSMLVAHEVFADSDERDAWRRTFISDHGGFDNAGKTAFAELEGADGDVSKSLLIERLGTSHQDGQFIQRYREKVRAICIAFGVPLTMLGDASGRTFANAAEEHAVFWEQRLPDLAELQEALTLQLAPRFGGTHEVWFDTSGIAALKQQNDPVTAQVGAPALVQAQIITVNEARADYGLPPLDGGDVVMSAEDIAALRGQQGEARAALVRPDHKSFRDIAAALVKGVDDGRGSTPDSGSGADPGARSAGSSVGGEAPGDDRGGTEDREPPAGDRAPRPEAIPAQAFPIGQHAGLNDRETRALAAIAKLDKQTASEQRMWEHAYTGRDRRGKATGLFTRQRDAVLERFGGKRGNRLQRALEARAPEDDLAASLFDREYWDAQTEDVVTPLLEHTLNLGADSTELAIDFDLAAESVQEFITERTNMLVAVNDGTYEDIQREMAEGVAKGESIPDLAARIEQIFGRMIDGTADTQSRATTIARTEVLSAYSAGKASAGNQAPPDVVAGFEWIATRDSRTRDAHAAVDGQVIGRGERFSVGGSSMAYPGDPAGPTEQTINCRCTMVTLTPEQFEQATATRSVTLHHARLAIALVHPGVVVGDEFRTALLEVAA